MSIRLNRRSPMTSPRIIFFGTRCFFADHVLDQLVNGGHEIVARIVPGYRGAPVPCQMLQGPGRSTGKTLPLVNNGGSNGTSKRTSSIPTLMVHNHRSPETAGMLTSFEADLAIVCCYPMRLPRRLNATTRLGGLNVHPSLLPAYRGPEPLFWMYRDGALSGGVTIHKVAAELDAGDVIAQRAISINIGKPGDELWRESAELAAAMLLDVLPDHEHCLRSATPQPSHNASYQSWPTRDDLLIDPGECDAWRLFHFCRGALPLGYSPLLELASGIHQIVSTSGYVDEGSQVAPESDPDDERIVCRSGEIYVRLSRGES